MASAAEARIRVKAEALLRDAFPGARIVHEFDLGGVRLDLAAITEDRLALLEIKSELDTLKRLDKQVRWAIRIGGPALVCYAPKWAPAIREVRSGDLWRAEWLEETEDGFSGLHHGRLAPHHDRYDNRLLFHLLLKQELLDLAKPFGAKSRQTVREITRVAHENMTGQQIRRGVMAALRARNFGWTCDRPIIPTDDQGGEG